MLIHIRLPYPSLICGRTAPLVSSSRYMVNSCLKSQVTRYDNYTGYCCIMWVIRCVSSKPVAAVNIRTDNNSNDSSLCPQCRSLPTPGGSLVYLDQSDFELPLQISLSQVVTRKPQGPQVHTLTLKTLVCRKKVDRELSSGVVQLLA